MNKLTVAVLISALIVSHSAAAVTYENHPAPRAESPMRYHDAFGMLTLTDEQRASIQAIRDTRYQEIKQLWKAWYQSEDELVYTEYFDEQKVRERVAGGFMKIREEEEVIRLRARHKMYNVLTPSQKTQLAGDGQEKKPAEAPPVNSDIQPSSPAGQ